MISPTTDPRPAPSATRMPISRVRCVTRYDEHAEDADRGEGERDRREHREQQHVKARRRDRLAHVLGQRLHAVERQVRDRSRPRPRAPARSSVVSPSSFERRTPSCRSAPATAPRRSAVARPDRARTTSRRATTPITSAPTLDLFRRHPSSMCLPIGSSPGEELLHGALGEQGDRRAAGPVLAGKHPAALERDAHRVKVIGVGDANLECRLVSRRRLRPARDAERQVERRRRRRHHHHGTEIGHAGQRAKTLGHVTIERRSLVVGSRTAPPAG